MSSQRHTRARWSGAFIATLALLGTLVGCAGPSAPPSASEPSTSEDQSWLPADDRAIDPNSTLRVAAAGTISNFDPHRSPSGWDKGWLSLVYDRLIDTDYEGNLIPGLATSWEFVDDGMALQLTLRDDVKFTDGDPVDAAAVKANLDRARTLEDGTLTAYVSSIDSVDIVDDQTIKLNLNRPAGDLPYLLSERSGMIASPAAFDTLSQHPVGSGSYTVTDYNPNDRMFFERNEQTWQPERAQSAKIQVLAQSSATTRLNMLQTGQVDITDVPPTLVDQAERAGFDALVPYSTAAFVLPLNARREGIDDVRVREAISHAIDREALVEGLRRGIGDATVQMLPMSYWASVPELTVDGWYDPELSRELLAEAGYEDGLDFEWIIPAMEDLQLIGEAIAPMLEEVGINVELNVVELARAGEVFYVRGEGDAAIGQTSSTPDPTITYQQFLPDSFYNMGVSSTEFEDAYNAANIGETQEERTEAVHEMVRVGEGLFMSLPLFFYQQPMLMSDDVVVPEGYRLTMPLDVSRLALAAD